MEDENHISTPPAPEAIAPVALAPVQRISLSEILNSSWELLQKKFWVLLGISLIMSVVMVLVTLAVGIPATLLVLASFLVKIPALTVAIGGLAIIALIIAISWVASWETIAMITAINNETNSTVLELISASKSRARTILPIILVVILTLLGGAVLIIPAIVMGISLSFVTIVAILEGKGLWDSFTTSRDLVRGRWWNLFITLIGFVIIGIIIIAMTGSSYSPLMLIIAPFSMILSYVLYKKLKSLPVAAMPTSRGVWYYQLAAAIGVIIIAGSLVAAMVSVGTNWEGFRERFDDSPNCEADYYIHQSDSDCMYDSEDVDEYSDWPTEPQDHNSRYYYDDSSLEITR